MTVNKIKIFNGKIFKNKSGNLIKYISKKNIYFRKFGEVYFNHIKFKKTKGWIRHKKNNCLIQCVKGKVKFFFIDKDKNKKNLIISSSSGNVLLIPSKIWFSFKSILNDSIIVNMIEEPHDDNEIEKK
tara:strand:- start:393 stop:776 length:384 start_codon:yes stop_codon:yes gene_type:complete